MTRYYLDSSAAVKLAMHEAESDALATFLQEPGASGAGTELVSSELLVTEIHRALRPQGAQGALRATRVLGLVDIVSVSSTVLRVAAEIPQDSLRTLNAIHLATALAVHDTLAGLITYDHRLAAAASEAGIPVVSPS